MNPSRDRASGTQLFPHSTSETVSGSLLDHIKEHNSLAPHSVRGHNARAGTVTWEMLDWSSNRSTWLDFTEVLPVVEIPPLFMLSVMSLLSAFFGSVRRTLYSKVQR